MEPLKLTPTPSTHYHFSYPSGPPLAVDDVTSILVTQDGMVHLKSGSVLYTARPSWNWFKSYPMGTVQGKS